MRKRTIILFAACIMAFYCVQGFASSEDKGPDEIILKSTIDPAVKPKPAFFPHALHQEVYFCSTCHHSAGANGEKILYKEGMEIPKCESCHNKAAARSRTMPKRLTPFMNAAHQRCKGCHKRDKKGPVTCKGCHKPNLK